MSMSKQILGNVLRWSDARTGESLLVPAMRTMHVYSNTSGRTN